MAKEFAQCALCGAKKFVNFAYLCKRCNNKEEGHAIVRKAITLRDAKAEAKAARAEAAAQEATTVEEGAAQDEESPAEQASSEEPKEE